MNNRIYIKRSNVPNKVPTSADIDLGELALNTADVKLYASGTTANSILQIGWDRVSRTGDTLTGDFNINGSITANTITVNNDLFLNGITLFTGTSRNIGVDINNKVVELPIDETLTILGTNKTGVSIAKGSVVYITGGQANRPTIALALADTNVNTSLAVGITLETIANNGTGIVVTDGIASGLNTSAFADGDRVYLSPTIAGGLTTTIPTSPNQVTFIGTVINAHATQGIILVNVLYSFKLDRLTDVAISAVTNNDILTYETSTGLWKNKQIGSIGVSFSGTTNFLQKINSTSGLTNSLIYDNGTALGIATTNVTGYTVTIGSQSNRSIGVETNLSGDGKSLTIAGGNGIGSTGLTFTITNTGIIYDGVTVAPNGDVYFSSDISSAGFYKQTGGVGAFVPLGQNGNWFGMASAANGDIYCVFRAGDIYKQTGGVGAFVGIGETSRDWIGICVASNGDIYACVNNGDIYKQTGGVGAFVALGQTSREWVDLEELNGDIYATAHNAGIYKQTGGVGAFVSIPFIGGNARGITKLNGDIYVCNLSSNVYKQTGGVGAFIQIATSLAGSLYAIAGGNNKLYVVGTSYGISNVIASNGGNLILQTGAGVGNGTSSIDFKLGLIDTSGITQTLTTKMSLANNGDLTLTGRYIKSGGSAGQFLKADGSVDSNIYLTTETDTLQAVTNRGTTTTTTITTNGYIKTGGLATQFLKADGSIDSSTYLTTETDTLQSVTTRGAITTTNITANAFIKAGGISTQFLMADGSVSLGGGGSVSFTGTTNFLQKLNATSALTNSLIHDNGIGLGIGTTAFTTTATTIQFGNQVDRKITIEPKLSGLGKTLIVQGGDGIDGTTVAGGNANSFTIYNSDTRVNFGITVALNGDIYVSTAGSDIYKQTGGIGAFVAQGQGSRHWRDMFTDLATGDIYVTVDAGGDIYKQTGGVGAFVAQGQAARNWYGICVNSVNGDVYATDVNFGDIYKRTGGVGTFNGLGQAARQWTAIVELNGDIYAAEYNGNIYKQTGGVGNFISLGVTNRSYQGLTKLGNSLYAATDGPGDIYVRTNNIGDFTPLGQTLRGHFSITNSNGNLYAAGQNFITKSPALSITTGAGGTLKLIGGDTTDTTVTTAQTDNFTFFQNSPGNTRGMGTGYNGDVYLAGCCGMGGYKLINGAGTFTPMAGFHGGINWEFFAGAPNGDIYGSSFGNLYKSVDGGATIGGIILGGTIVGIHVAANGDVYAGDYGGDIYKSINNGGSFTPLGQTGRNWISITSLGTDIYALVNGGDIYKQTNGTGNFIALGQGNRAWRQITTNNGNVYANAASDSIYKQTGGVGNFVSIGNFNNWYGLANNSITGEMYGSVESSSIYKSPVSTVSDNFSGGSVSIETGIGYGNASNSIDFVTSTPIASAAGIQTKTTKMQILGNGYIKMTSIPTFADNAAAISGGLTIGTLYKTSLGELMIVI